MACATENILKFVEKYFCLLGSKFSFNNNVFWVGQSKRHLLRRILNLYSHMPIMKKILFLVLETFKKQVDKIINIVSNVPEFVEKHFSLLGSKNLR